MEKSPKDGPVLREDLPPLELEKMLKEKGYGSEDIASWLKKDILFVSSRKTGSPAIEAITPETLTIKKYLSQEKNSLKIDFAFDKAGYRYLELLSAEIYVGIIVFLTITAWDLAKGFISSWLYEQYKGMQKDSKDLNVKLEVEIRDEKKGRIYHIKYAGPADKVAEIIKERELK
jgi:hypothetical protein